MHPPGRWPTLRTEVIGRRALLPRRRPISRSLDHLRRAVITSTHSRVVFGVGLILRPAQILVATTYSDRTKERMIRPAHSTSRYRTESTNAR